ncbi:hypothetical protein MUB24_15170 [Lederbergia sp. NSJ-179]|uniref:hypothetical protein n=1 Tax=Lederbergia sp. NSJ-179 TaxID=2931402 RepID=UPI001FD01361|nr:hypothetical protein [Lederbergia sp. NSJ-179]MCJ7842214.1 hypothetical protein [Lederbergia sp. NSJ-179]
MAVNEQDKPHFNVDQVVPASLAAKRFGEVRKKAKVIPQFISENNRIDSVLLDYKEYEKLYMELEALSELSWEINLARRIEKADAANIRYHLKEVMGKNGYEEFRRIDPNAISDEELFE